MDCENRSRMRLKIRYLLWGDNHVNAALFGARNATETGERKQS